MGYVSKSKIWGAGGSFEEAEGRAEVKEGRHESPWAPPFSLIKEMGFLFCFCHVLAVWVDYCDSACNSGVLSIHPVGIVVKKDKEKRMFPKTKLGGEELLCPYRRPKSCLKLTSGLGCAATGKEEAQIIFPQVPISLLREEGA